MNDDDGMDRSVAVWIPPKTDVVDSDPRIPACPFCGHHAHHHRTGRCSVCGRHKRSGAVPDGAAGVQGARPALVFVSDAERALRDALDAAGLQGVHGPRRASDGSSEIAWLMTGRTGEVAAALVAFGWIPPGGDPQAGWPAHLRDDAPQARCSGCGRWSVAVAEFSRVCGMPQPDGVRCTGVFSDPRVR